MWWNLYECMHVRVYVCTSAQIYVYMLSITGLGSLRDDAASTPASTACGPSVLWIFKTIRLSV